MCTLDVIHYNNKHLKKTLVGLPFADDVRDLARKCGQRLLAVSIAYNTRACVVCVRGGDVGHAKFPIYKQVPYNRVYAFIPVCSVEFNGLHRVTNVIGVISDVYQERC